MNKYTYVCTTCGSDQVLLDAWARWTTDTQEWELSSTFDSAYCEKCGGECRIEQQPIE